MGYLDRNYYFLHIPKTAGTSFTSAFDTLFSSTDIFPLQTWLLLSESVLKTTLINDLFTSRYRFIRGHFTHNDKICKNRFVISFFRNPFTRTVSQLKHIQEDPIINAWIDPKDVSITDSMFDLLNNQIIINYISDLQTKSLFYHGDISEKMKAFDKGIKFYDQYIPEIGNPLITSKFWARLKIIRELLSLNFIGIQEFFPESLLLLSNLLSVKLPISNERKMVFGKQSEEIEVEDKHAEIIKSINTYDYILYNNAERIFLKRWCDYLKSEYNIRIKPKEYRSERLKYLNLLNIHTI